MSSPAIAPLDIASRAPSAGDLFNLGRRGSGPSPSPWDPARWDAVIQAPPPGVHLAHLSRLMELWEPLYEATPRRDPGTELLSTIQGSWGRLSYERRFFERRLREAENLDPLDLYAQEEGALDAETRGPVQLRSLAGWLRDAVAEWRSLLSRRAQGGHPAVLTTDPQRAVWVMENLATFLMAHWALRHAHDDLRAFIRRRDELMEASIGITNGSPGLADRHDDLA